MKKFIQPKQNKTLVILNNGSIYTKDWSIPKNSLRVESNTKNNSLKSFFSKNSKFNKKKYYK